MIFVFPLLFLLLGLRTASAVECCNLKCQCDDGIINCDGKHLTSIPTCESEYNRNYQKLTLRFNNITTPDLTKIPSEVAMVDFSHNSISTFSVTTMNTQIKVLNLQFNKLTSVPMLSNFPNLIDLDISRNPIPSDNSGYPTNVMRQLGSKLEAIHIGDSNTFTAFPRPVSDHLQNIHTLEVNGASPRFQYVPPYAFHSFESRLKNLTIRETTLQSLPLALSGLHNLEELHFDGNPVGDYGIIAEAFYGLTNLKILTLRMDGLSTFPAIVDNLDHLTTLSLDSNHLQYIRELAFDMINSSRIVDLSLQNCSLDRVPGSVSNHLSHYLQKMERLNFGSNNIQSIDRNDLQNLQDLKYVSFANNPLAYISTDAFTGIPNLDTIDFSHTKLPTIPTAIKNTPNLKRVILDGTEVECTCDLVPVKHFPNIGNIHFTGECETITSTLNNYLDVFVPNCPLFNYK